jgi:phage terminase small subunit
VVEPEGSAVKSPPSEQNSPPAADRLTFRRARFVDEYIICGNQTEAARLAGFSVDRADVEGSELMKDPLVAAAIAQRQAEIKKKLGITQERVLTEQAAIAFSDIGEILVESEAGIPQIRPLRDWSPSTRKAIRSVKVKRHHPRTDREGRVIEEGYDILEFGLWDKPGQLEKLSSRLDSEKVANTGVALENLSDAERLRIIADVLSRGRQAMQAMQAAKAPKKKAS